MNQNSANNSAKIYKTTEGGINWINCTPSNTEILWGNYFVDKDTGVCVGGGCDTPLDFFRTVNGGKSWSRFELPAANSGLTHVRLYSGTGLGYAISSRYLYKTTDGGRSWIEFSNTGISDWHDGLSISGNTFLMPSSQGCSGGGNGGGIRLSTNNGSSWTNKSFPNPLFSTFLIDSSRGWVCGDKSQIYYSSDIGQNWLLKNGGIPDNTGLDNIFFINDSIGWVSGQKIFTTLNNPILSDILEPINSSENKLISITPNPFSEKTEIRCSLVEPANIRFSVFDLMGNILEYKDFGLYNTVELNIQFLGEKYSSGIYFYKIEIGKEVKCGMMNLVK